MRDSRRVSEEVKKWEKWGHCGNFRVRWKSIEKVSTAIITKDTPRVFVIVQ